MSNLLGLNTAFSNLNIENFQEYDFSVAISLLDYDAVIIDVSNIAKKCYGTSAGLYQNKIRLSDYASHQIVEDYNTIREQIIELLKHRRNVFILMGRNENCYIYTGEREYSGTGKNARQTLMVKEFNTYSFLPISVKPTHICGTEIDICCKSPYRDFLKLTEDKSQYDSYFTVKEDSTPLARIKGTDKIVAAVVPYENGKIVLLPRPYYKGAYEKTEYWEECGREYLKGLCELCNRLSNSEKELSLPGWAHKMHILDETTEIQRQKEIQEQIKVLKLQLADQENRIAEIQEYKLLLTASGSSLEEIVKKVLSELGFSILDAAKGRSDIVAKYGEISVVAEIKGVTKSAAEKHAAQLEKWVSQHIEENNAVPKALLIVNGFCDIPVIDRTEDVFPHQMLKYCEARRHILITTTQLLCLYIEAQRNPAGNEKRIEELLSSVGKYERYQNISDYLDPKE